MARILPRLLARIERQPKQAPTVFPFRAQKRKPKSLYRPPLPLPSFHPADHPQSILLSPGSPVTDARDYAYHKMRPPSPAKPPKDAASALPDPPRQMSPAELGWWSNPYLRMLSSPLRLCSVTQRHVPSDLLIRLVGMQLPSDEQPGAKPMAKLVPDGILHPKYTNRKVSKGTYVLCWRKAVELLQKGSYKRLSHDLSLYPNLAQHIAHLLRLRVLQEFELLADRMSYDFDRRKRLGNPSPDTILRRLTYEEYGSMRATGSVPYQNAVAVLVLPPVNKDVGTGQRPEGSMSQLPPEDEHIPPNAPPTSTLLKTSDDSDEDLPGTISPLRIPLYNAASAFPSRSQRAALYSLLMRILKTEEHVRGLHPKIAQPRSPENQKSSHAFLLCSDNKTAKRGDPAAIALALWRLRMYDSEGWANSIPTSDN